MRDAFPPLRDLPAMSACFGLVAFLCWAMTHHERFRAVVLEAVDRAAFWQIVCAGLLMFVAAAGFAFWQSEKEDA